MRTSKAGSPGCPHIPLSVPVSPRHSGRIPDSPTLTLAPMRACSDLTSLAPLAPLPELVPERQVPETPHPKVVPREDHRLLYGHPVRSEPPVLGHEGPRLGGATEHV